MCPIGPITSVGFAIMPAPPSGGIGALPLMRLLLLLPLLLLTASGQAQQPRPKVIVLGFDGVDGAWTERWMNEGRLPNLARLRDQGAFRHLRPTLPAQTPVSW